jgi:hypothetical protein
MTPERDYHAIRTRVNEGLKKQKFRARLAFFLVSLFMFLLFVFISVFMITGLSTDVSTVVGTSETISSSGAAGGALLMFTMGWLTSIMFQGISLFFDTKAGEDSMRERLVAREIGKEMMRMGGDELEEKRKHMLRLGDDGELQEVVEDEGEPEIKRQHRA